MRALRNFGERDLRITEVDAPPPPGDDEIQVRICAVALNHIDVWGWRGMAFAKRELPITVGAEASGEIIAVGKNVKGLKVGQTRGAIWRQYLWHAANPAWKAVIISAKTSTVYLAFISTVLPRR